MELNLLVGLNSEYISILRDEESSVRGCSIYKMLYRGLDMGVRVIRKSWNNHQEIQVGFEPTYFGGEWYLRDIVFYWNTMQEVVPKFQEGHHKYSTWKSFLEMPICRNVNKWRWEVISTLMTDFGKIHFENRMMARSQRLQAAANLAKMQSKVVSLFYNRDEDVMLE